MWARWARAVAGAVVVRAAVLLAAVGPWASAVDAALLDPTFGGDGRVLTAVGPYLNWGYDAAVQPDGKILITGFAQGVSDHNRSVFATLRLQPDGAPDPTFGIAGTVLTNFDIVPLCVGSESVAYAIARTADGKILVAGTATGGCLDSGPFGAALARYDANGALDPTFAGAGRVVSPVQISTQYPKPLTLQPDGRILLVGEIGGQVAIARYQANGSIDATFGTGGTATTPLAAGARGVAAAVQADGKIVAIAYASTMAGLELGVVRFLADGTLDTAFGIGGSAITDVGGNGYFLPSAVAIQSDQKILVSGAAYNSVNNDLAVVRYNTDGTLDTTFGGGDGIVLTRVVSRYDDRGTDMAVQSDGKIVVTGFSSSSFGDSGLTVVRYNSDGTLDTTFDGNGSAFLALGKKDRVGGQGMTLQPDGKIIVVGARTNPAQTASDIFVVRVLGTPTCPAVPTSGCRTSERAKLSLMKSSDDRKDKLQWKWLRGDAVTLAELADPTASSGFAFCVYAGPSNALIATAAIPPGSRWKSAGTVGYTYSGLASEGLTRIKLKSGVQTAAGAQVKGGGSLLPDPARPVELPVTVQLLKDGAPLCLESTFTAADVRNNDAEKFSASK